MHNKKLDFLDFKRVNSLLEGFNKSTGFVTAILDLDGNILSTSGWRRICTEFHRKHPKSAQKCTCSDTLIANQAGGGEKYHFYTCLNGLIDVVVPFVIGGEHTANLFSGQFFLEEPDISFFRKQAGEYGFEEDSYIKALQEVPVVSREKVKAAMDFLQNMTLMISDMTIQKLEQVELHKAKQKSEAALQESEKKYRVLFNAFPLGITISGPTGRIVESNAIASELLGLPKDKSKLRLFDEGQWRIIRPDGTPMPENEYASVRALKEHRFVENIEMGIVKEDDSIRWVNVTAAPILLENYGVAVVYSDITERKRMESKHKESEFQFQNLANAGAALIWTSGTDKLCNYFNDPWLTFTGRTMQQEMGIGWTEGVHPEDFDRCLEIYTSAFDRREPFEMEYRLRHSSGEYRIILDLGTPNYSSNGEFIGYIGHCFDITQRRQTEDALKKSESDLTMAQRIAHVGSWEYDIASESIFGSDEGFRIYGLQRPASGLLPIHEIEACVPDSRRVHQALVDLIEKDVPYDIEYMINPADEGESKIIVSKALLIKDNDGKPIKVRGIIQDITERKRAEEERKKLEDQLALSQKMESVGRLAGGVAHDFNNMLGVILGYTDMAMEQVDSAKPLYSDLLEVRNAADRSAELTRQLLAFARKQTVSPKVLDLNTTVSDMHNMLQRLIGEDIELLWKPCGDLWPVSIDPSQVDQLLVNLILNARDAINGVGTITIETENKVFDRNFYSQHGECRQGEFLILAVSDNGCGIDEEAQEHLFEPFFTTKEVGRGTGLGLATVYGIVNQNNGFIHVDSVVGSGTTIRVFLPRHKAEDAPVEMVRDARTVNYGYETILLVEDEPAILNITMKMLERLGYTVITSRTPEEAVNLAREHTGQIDLLITDVVMPEMNGRELTKNLHASLPDLRSLYMSGYTADVIAKNGVLEDGMHFIQKPFTMKDLAIKVQEALEP